MKQQEIQAFLAIAKYRTLSAAAESLHYAQPTISANLTRLEQSLGGVQLVKRTKGKREVDLTPAGMEFLHLAQQYADLDQRISRFIKDHQRGSLRLAASVISHQYIVCHLIQKLIRIVPDVEIRLSTLEIKDTEQAMENHEFDIAICYDSPALPVVSPKYITKIPLFEEEYCLLCPIDTPLPDRLLTPEDLDPAFEVYHEGYGIQLLQEWRAEHNLTNTKPYFHASSMLSVHNYLTDPRCWGFVLSNVAEHMAAVYPDTLTIRRLAQPPAQRTCNALILKSYPEEDVIRALLQCMDAYIAERPHLQKYTPADVDGLNSCILQENPAIIK